MNHEFCQRYFLISQFIRTYIQPLIQAFNNFARQHTASVTLCSVTEAYVYIFSLATYLTDYLVDYANRYYTY